MGSSKNVTGVWWRPGQSNGQMKGLDRRYLPSPTCRGQWWQQHCSIVIKPHLRPPRLPHLWGGRWAGLASLGSATPPASSPLWPPPHERVWSGKAGAPVDQCASPSPLHAVTTAEFMALYERWLASRFKARVTISQGITVSCSLTSANFTTTKNSPPVGLAPVQKKFINVTMTLSTYFYCWFCQ
jgi:hypothetical protein